MEKERHKLMLRLESGYIYVERKRERERDESGIFM